MELPLDPDAYPRIVFFTGAGLSAESGLATYRGKGGTWGSYDYHDVACESAFRRDPNAVWEFHELRREKMAAAQPCSAHQRIAAIQESRAGVSIITQNIDGLHQRAGARDVVELHGSIWRVRCACTGGEGREHLERPLPTRRCPTCAQWLRPDIGWFEDMLRAEVLERAAAALAVCDLLISIGTSAAVYPAAALPQIAAQGGALRVEINPEQTPVSPLYSLHLREGASAGLGRLLGTLPRREG